MNTRGALVFVRATPRHVRHRDRLHDQNSIYEGYEFEFSESADFTKVAAAIKLGKNATPPLQTRPELKPGKIYFVRMRVLTRETGIWSSPGPVCAVGMCPP
jgi:hypothetical protein